MLRISISEKRMVHHDNDNDNDNDREDDTDDNDNDNNIQVPHYTLTSSKQPPLFTGDFPLSPWWLLRGLTVILKLWLILS